jgi:hypothetical protein
LFLAVACQISAIACNGQGAGGSDEDVDRIVQGVAEGKKVTVTLHLERPGEPKRDHRVSVVRVEFDPQGALKTVYFNDRGSADQIPAAGFRKVLVRSAPITVQ